MLLEEFYFADPAAYVVPVEHQTPEGLTPVFAALLRERRPIGAAGIELLEAALRRYEERLGWMGARARGTWFSPRRQNLCIVTEPRTTRPYIQPFDRASWLLYESDLDPATSSVEHATFQLVHAERLGLTRKVAPTVVQNLAWFLVRTEAELEDFAAGCRRSTRPDAAAFVALADALPWIRRLHHAKLAPPGDDLDDLRPIPGADLLVPRELGPSVRALVEVFDRTAREVLAGQRAAQAEPIPGVDPVARLGEWLAEHRPRVLVVDADGREVWDPRTPEDLDRLEEAVSGLTARAAVSLCADLEIVGARSDRFLEAVVDPDALPTGSVEVEPDGGTYLHDRRRIVVYSLAQPGLDVLHEGGPPLHRLLLGARTMHEWGHLATDAGIVRVAPEREAEHRAAREALTEAFAAAVAEAPAAVRDATRRALADRGGSAALAEIPLQRMGDYCANVVSRALLPGPELEAYVRANVRSLRGEPGSPLELLARHAFEIQYLYLSRMEDPERYFLASTGFARSFVAPRIVSLDRARAVFAAMARVCACHTLDPARIRIEPPL